MMFIILKYATFMAVRKLRATQLITRFDPVEIVQIMITIIMVIIKWTIMTIAMTVMIKAMMMLMVLKARYP